MIEIKITCKNNKGDVETGNKYLFVQSCKHPLQRASWSKLEARIGEEVSLKCEYASGYTPSRLRFTIFEHDADDKHDEITSIEGVPKDGSCSVPWKIVDVGDTDDVESALELAQKGYTLPEFFFVVSDPGDDAVGSIDSGKEEAQLLEVSDVIERTFHDELTDKPMPGAAYVITLPGGKEIEGKLDQNSKAVMGKVPPGRFWFRLKNGNVKPCEYKPAIPLGLKSKAAVALSKVDRPELKAAQGAVTITSVTSTPKLITRGEQVKLEARVQNADGETATFQIKKLGSGGGEVARLEAPIQGGVATTDWTVTDATGGEFGGFQSAAYDVAVRVNCVVWDSIGVPEFRAYVPSADAADGAAGPD